MTPDRCKSRSLASRGAAASPSPSGTVAFFSESPVLLPSLDALRTSDVLVRAYYVSLAPTLPTALPVADTSSVKAYVPPASILAAAGELETTGEIFCAAVAREVVEAAANLFASRSLDRLVGAYTACAAWDDMRDVVATSFLLQDHREGVAVAHCPGFLLVDTAAPPNNKNSAVPTTSAPTPLFLRSAFSLAGVPTRAPSCALTLLSSTIPSPLTACHQRSSKPMQLPCPMPPASVPMDAYCRYVMAVEEAPVPPRALDTVPPSHRSGVARVRGTKKGALHSDKGTAALSAAPSLSPSPPAPASFKRFKWAKRMGVKRLTGASLDSALPTGGEIAPASGVQEHFSDALTTAMRQALPSLFADNVECLPHAERCVVRVIDTNDSNAQLGSGEAERKHIFKASPRNGGAVLVVEQDRLLNMERARVVLPRSDRCRDGVLCRVTPSSCGADAAMEEDAALAKLPTKDGDEEPPRRARGTKRQTSGKIAAQAKEMNLAREAWTSSFYTTVNASEEIPLQDQVEVYPSAGVTVMEANASASASPLLRRSNKAGGGNTVVASGGEFVVPADRMALCSFADKRTAARKGNGHVAHTQKPQRGNTRAARSTKAALPGAPCSEH